MTKKTKRETSNSPWRHRFFSPWPWRSRSAISTGPVATRQSSSTATKASGKFGASYFLRLAFLALLVAGVLWEREGPTADLRVEELLARHWVWLDRNPCPGAEPGSFFELSGESESIELLVTSGEQALAARESLPEVPFACVPIQKPNFIQEI